MRSRVPGSDWKGSCLGRDGAGGSVVVRGNGSGSGSGRRGTGAGGNDGVAALAPCGTSVGPAECDVAGEREADAREEVGARDEAAREEVGAREAAFEREDGAARDDGGAVPEPRARSESGACETDDRAWVVSSWGCSP